MNTPHLFRDDFPILKKNIVYFDSASTTLKPNSVIKSFNEYYENYTSNIYRSTHILAEQATIAYEEVRESVASFIKADKSEIIFTANCSDSINLVSSILKLQKEDEIICSVLEHHSNYLPWQQKATLKVVPLIASGVIDIDVLLKNITKKTRLIAITFASNVTGNIQPVADIIKIAKQHNILVLIDAAQAVGHFPINVSHLGCDFMAFTAHKMLGPSGVGVLYCRRDLLATLSPIRFGGGMINHMTGEDLHLKPIPYCFEVGTPNIENVIAFGKAIEYLKMKNFNTIKNYLDELNQYFIKKITSCEHIYFPFALGEHRIPIFSFAPKTKNVDIKYIGRILSDTYQIAVSVGLQCCQPLYQAYKIEGTIRVSLYLYNSKNEIDHLINALNEMHYLLNP